AGMAADADVEIDDEAELFWRGRGGQRGHDRAPWDGAKHPLSGPAGHLSPCPGERNPGWKSAGIAAAHFLSPGQGERWTRSGRRGGALSILMSSTPRRSAVRRAPCPCARWPESAV